MMLGVPDYPAYPITSIFRIIDDSSVFKPFLTSFHQFTGSYPPPLNLKKEQTMLYSCW